MFTIHKHVIIDQLTQAVIKRIIADAITKVSPDVKVKTIVLQERTISIKCLPVKLGKHSSYLPMIDDLTEEQLLPMIQDYLPEVWVNAVTITEKGVSVTAQPVDAPVSLHAEIGTEDSEPKHNIDTVSFELPDAEPSTEMEAPTDLEQVRKNMAILDRVAKERKGSTPALDLTGWSNTARPPKYDYDAEPTKRTTHRH